MVIRLACICLLFAAFALGFAAVVSRDSEKFISLTSVNRCVFGAACSPPD